MEGEKLLQLDTYGTADRVIPNKVSQSLQFDHESAAVLRQILDEVFPESPEDSGVVIDHAISGHAADHRD